MPDGSSAELHDVGVQRPCAGVDREARECAGVAGGWKARTTRASTGRGGRGGGRRRDGGRRWAVGGGHGGHLVTTHHKEWPGKWGWGRVKAAMMPEN
uniref:Uncharacterized protein n=1 Tax=Oryza glumipatula TaxID=40148 RepID=A0A0D9ZWK5_9ORYZ